MGGHADDDRADKAERCVEEIAAAVYGRNVPFTAEGVDAVLHDVVMALSRFRAATRFPREQITVDQFREAVGIERASHAVKGYDEAHDRAHGVPHLLRWAIDYASRGEAVKSGALIMAALSLSESLEREDRDARAERDALAHVLSLVRAWDAKGWSEDTAADCAELRVILDTAPTVSLARHDAEVKAHVTRALIEQDA